MQNQKSSTIIRKRKLSSLNDVPDPCRYNPNYDAIYKKVPSVIMSVPSSNTSRKPKHKDNNDNNKIQPNNIITNNERINIDENSLSRSSSPKSRNNNNSDKIFQTEISVSSSSQSNHKHTSLLPPIDHLRKNHALRFDQYPNRKSIIMPVLNERISYLEPIDYTKQTNKAVDFRKMRKRGQFDLINISHLHTPGFNYYQPKYALVEKTLPHISFSPRNKPEPSRKFLVKQIMKSSDVPLEYQIIKECNDIKQLKDEDVKEI